MSRVFCVISYAMTTLNLTRNRTCGLVTINIFSVISGVMFLKRNEAYCQHLPCQNVLITLAKTLAAIHPTKLFPLPSWIPPLRNPEIPFNLDPPTCQQVTSVIRKMKASGSPCPLDQLSIICFKRCPFLRTHLTELIRAVWLSGSVPAEWKRAWTILIHKKDDDLLTFDLSLLKPYL